MFFQSKSKHLNWLRVYKKAKNIYYELPPVKERRKVFYAFFALKYLSLSIIVLFLIVVVLLGWQIVKAKIIYQGALAGKENLTYAVSLLKERKYQSAVNLATTAQQNFNTATLQLDNLQKNLIIKSIRVFDKPIKNIARLLTTAEILSRAAGDMAKFGLGSEAILRSDLIFSQLSKTEKRNFLRFIYESAPELNGIKANLDLAILNLDSVEFTYLFLPFKHKVLNLENQLIEIQTILSKAIPVAELLPAFLGYPNKSAFLLILQNSNELRPTGGFIGSYGVIETDSGDILRSDTHDIYHLDMPVKDKIKITPPDPIKKYLGVNQWYMRDANWSPDWPTSARQIELFYWQEDKLLPPKDQINNFKGKFTGVIAITPKFITDLLHLIGPVNIDNEEYNENNFTKLLEYRVEKGYIQLGIPAWHRKEVIGDILKEIKLKLFDQASLKLYEIFNIVNKNLVEKNILIYFDDNHLQDLAREQSWTGEVQDTTGDYVMVVDANMASLKTDAVINRNINYSLNQNQSGLYVNLIINYSHNGSFDWQTTRYNTYIRIYVPLDSQLINNRRTNQADFKTSQELGKTVFSTFLTIEPGQIGSLEISYRLPDKITELIVNNGYHLYFQKQPGQVVDILTFDLNFINNIKSYQPVGFYISKNNNKNINWKTDFVGDKELVVKF